MKKIIISLLVLFLSVNCFAGLQKNVASQKIAVYAYDTAAGAPIIDDEGNITCYYSLDGAADVQTTDANPVPIDDVTMPGIYVFDLEQGETNGNMIVIYAKSATADVQLDPIIVFTDPPNFNVLSIAATGEAQADVKEISTSATAANNMEIVFDTDFATGYDAVNDMWNVDAELVDGAAPFDATTEIGVAGAGLTAVVWNSDWDAQVQSEINDEIELQNLHYLCKTAVANNADMTTEIIDGTILSNILSSTSDTSTYVVATDSQQAIADTLGVSGAGLTAIASVGAIAGNVGGNVTGNVTGNVGGTVATVTAMGANSITAASLNADAGVEIATSVMAHTGVTTGGTWTFEEVLRVIAALTVGTYEEDGVDASITNVLDPEDGVTVIAEITFVQAPWKKTVTATP